MNWINNEITKLVIRTLLKTGGGWFVAKGFLTGNETDQVAGAVSVLAGIIHHLWTERADIFGAIKSASTTPVIVTALLLSTCVTQAQVTQTTLTNGTVVITTNTATPPPSFGTIAQTAVNAFETATNWAVMGGYGHSVDGIGRNLAFAQLSVNFNDYMGIALGYDYLWGNNKTQYNALKGGLTLQVSIHPFAFLGSTVLTNVVATPFVYDEVATSNTGSVANITGGGVDFVVYQTGNLAFHLGGSYEERVGDSTWGGDYALVHLALTRTF